MSAEAEKRAMLLAHGDILAMVARPITGVLFLVAVGLILIQIIPAVSRYRHKALAE
jgi:TctA family transporter